MQGRTLRLLMAVGLVAVTACDDPTGLQASISNRELGMFVFPVNGSAQTLPTGILIRAPELARVDQRWAFDIAFDLNPAGGVTIHTVRALGSEVLGQLQRIGLQTDTTAYDNVTKAPVNGFVYDSSLTVPIGRTVLIDKLDASCSQFGGAFLGFNIKAKMVIESVDPVTRAISVKMLSNPNCGFRSLQLGVPKD